MKNVSVLLASLIVVACSSAPKNITAQSPLPADHGASSAASATGSTAVSTAEMELRQLAAATAQLQKQSEYFEYQKFEIKPEYQSIIKAEADFIKAHKNDLVTLEGNADERGSEEYNLSLGEKRAKAVQKRLAALGVPASQVKLVSLGKEKPRLSCHEEKCWKENRRVDFLHKLS